MPVHGINGGPKFTNIKYNISTFTDVLRGINLVRSDNFWCLKRMRLVGLVKEQTIIYRLLKS
ncbi:hypothetical protein CHS0354_018126 [Potamilus streckersoni]|uniref:Uncharacterized protein n=1 Tax=Potamilus streckersoni TaxID=2493646 RepID=A0AAE0STJ9_9BIVA|nr:hypothetical protein CHS0354_018126 [Potamilus streckersoni]